MTRNGQIALITLLGLFPIWARADDFRLESASLPAPLLDAGKVNTVIEASAVEPIGDGRRFLLAHDKAPSLYVVDTATGRLLGEPISSPRSPAPSSTGPKWEAMARDSDGNYDDDARATKIPSRFQTATLIREAR
jgi:hypothetical protein